MTLEKTVADCVATLEQARNVLRETALELLRTDVGVKGPLVAKMLEESDRIDIVCKGAKQSASKSQRLAGPCMEAGATASAQLLQTPHRKSPNVGTSVVTFPYVFISDGLLYKVGQKERPNPDGTRGTWWKSVSVEEALIIMKSIFSFDGSFRQSDVQEAVIGAKLVSSLPIYRVDIVISALKKIERIRSSKRGFYVVESGTPEEWMADLARLEKRGDLLAAQK